MSFVLSACAPATPDACAIVRSVATNYCDVQNYEIAWLNRITSAGSPSKTKTIRMRMVRAADGRFRREMATVPDPPMVNVSNGSQEWTFLPDKKGYVLSTPGSGPATRAFPDVAERLCAVGDSRVSQVKWLRSETLVFEGRSLTCDVIEVSPARTLWVDRRQGTVVREVQVFSNGTRDERDYELVRLRQEPSAERFTSPVPPGTAQLEAPFGGAVSFANTWQDRYTEAARRYEASQDDSDRLWALTVMAKAAFEIGRFAEARRHAQQALALASRFPKAQKSGDAVHDGHMVLGRLALKDGDIATSKHELLEAGKTPGSPGLAAFGPNMSLAKDLLERDERDVVLQYFELCSSFWEDRDVLRAWAETAKEGRIPDFGRNLRY